MTSDVRQSFLRRLHEAVMVGMNLVLYMPWSEAGQDGEAATVCQFEEISTADVAL